MILNKLIILSILILAIYGGLSYYYNEFNSSEEPLPLKIIEPIKEESSQIVGWSGLFNVNVTVVDEETNNS